MCGFFSPFALGSHNVIRAINSTAFHSKTEEIFFRFGMNNFIHLLIYIYGTVMRCRNKHTNYKTTESAFFSSDFFSVSWLVTFFSCTFFHRLFTRFRIFISLPPYLSLFIASRLYNSIALAFFFLCTFFVAYKRLGIRDKSPIKYCGRCFCIIFLLSHSNPTFPSSSGNLDFNQLK